MFAYCYFVEIDEKGSPIEPFNFLVGYINLDAVLSMHTSKDKDNLPFPMVVVEQLGGCRSLIAGRVGISSTDNQPVFIFNPDTDVKK